MKKTLIIIVILLVFILTGSFTAIAIASYKPTVAFYNVSEKVQNSILSEIQSMPVGKKNKTIRYNILILDGSIPLSAQKKAFKSDMIFATLDSDVRDVALSPKIKAQDSALLDGMPSTTQKTAVIKNEKLCAVPVLYDFYELDVFYPAFEESNIGKIDTWKDMKEFLHLTSNKEFAPLIFSGGEQNALTETFGRLVEAISGTDALINAEEKLYTAFKTGKKENVTAVLEELSKDRKILGAALNELKYLQKNQLINKSTLSFVSGDTFYFLNNSLCNSAFLKLSDHRKIDNQIINSYSSVYIPGDEKNSQRSFLAPTVCCLAAKNKKSVVSTLKMITSSRQASLSKNSGLAPVNASCGTPDKQADDVRFWLAASDGPVMPLSGALPSDEMKTAASDWLKTQIKLGN